MVMVVVLFVTLLWSWYLVMVFGNAFGPYPPIVRQYHQWLTPLLLYRNRLTEANEIGRACAELPNLAKVSARHNSIGSLDPADVRACNNLDQLELGYNRLATLTGTFDGLANLVKLGLIGNELACIDRQALDSLHRVREVEVDLRYLQCTCANNFVRDWMLQRRAKVVNYNCQAVQGSCLSASQLQPALTCPINPPCPEGCSCKVGMPSYLSEAHPRPFTFSCFLLVPDKP